MYSIEEKSARYIAVKEINSLLCEHCLYFGRRQLDLELERLWCKEAASPSFSQNNGSFVGYEALQRLYAGAEQRRKARYDKLLDSLEPEFSGQEDELRYGTNTLSLQTLSTPCIELAEDFQSAKGLWTVSAQVTAVDNSGPVGLWAYGKKPLIRIRECRSTPPALASTRFPPTPVCFIRAIPVAGPRSIFPVCRNPIASSQTRSLTALSPKHREYGLI